MLSKSCGLVVVTAFMLLASMQVEARIKKYPIYRPVKKIVKDFNVTKDYGRFRDVQKTAEAGGTADAVSRDFYPRKDYYVSRKQIRDTFLLADSDKNRGTATFVGGAVSKGGDAGKAYVEGSSATSFIVNDAKRKSYRKYKFYKKLAGKDLGYAPIAYKGPFFGEYPFRYGGYGYGGYGRAYGY